MLGERPSVYVVEDEPLLCENLILQFSVRGFIVRGSGIGADDIYRLMLKKKENNQSYKASVIVADLDIFSARTIEYAYLIKELQPDVKFVFFTLHKKIDKKTYEAVKDLNACLIRRPFKEEDMVEIVRRILESPGPVFEDEIEVVEGGEEDGEKGDRV